MLLGSLLRFQPYSQDFHSCYRTARPQKGFEGFLKGSLKGSLKGFEGFLKGFSKGFSKGPRTYQPKNPSKPLQNAFKNPSKTFQEGVEIDDALGFPGLKNQFQAPGVLWQKIKVLIILSL